MAGKFNTAIASIHQKLKTKRRFSMSDQAKARQMMVDCQIKPNGVINEAIIEAFENTPRELFLEGTDKAVAYIDKSLEPIPGRPLPSPMDHARLLQAAEIGENDYVLEVATGCGYGTAILSKLCNTVLTTDTFESPPAHTQSAWDVLDVCNVAYEKIKSFDSAPPKGPFDVIVINGTLCDIPQKTVASLSENGRLLCALQEKPNQLVRAVLVVPSDAAKHYSYTELFEVDCSYLGEAKPKKAFAF